MEPLKKQILIYKRLRDKQGTHKTIDDPSLLKAKEIIISVILESYRKNKHWEEVQGSVSDYRIVGMIMDYLVEQLDSIKTQKDENVVVDVLSCVASIKDCFNIMYLNQNLSLLYYAAHDAQIPVDNLMKSASKMASNYKGEAPRSVKDVLEDFDPWIREKLHRNIL